jgi:Flp pilus assembly pilin Flp
MMMTNKAVRDERGAAALEFALAAPVLITMVVGLAQLGIMYSANTGVHHAVEEGARLAAIFPTPTDDEIAARVLSTKFMVSGTAEPVVTRDETAAGDPYIDISLSYSVPLDFIFFSLDPVTVQHSRRVFRQLAAGATAGGTGTGTGTGEDPDGEAPEDPPVDTDPGKDKDKDGDNPGGGPPPKDKGPDDPGSGPPPKNKGPDDPGSGPPPKDKDPGTPPKTPGGLPPGNGKGKK